MEKQKKDFKYPVYMPEYHAYWVEDDKFVGMIPADGFHEAMKLAAENFTTEDYDKLIAKIESDKK